MNQATESPEHPWAFNSPRFKIFMGIPGDDQESSFMNATLQQSSGEPTLEFSIATHLDVPKYVRSEDSLANWLNMVFGDFVHEHPEVEIEIQIGPEGSGEED